MAVSPNLNSQLDGVLEQRFKKLTKIISMLLTVEGKYQKPYIEGLPYFSKLPTELKQKVVDHLQFYHDLCVEQVSEGYSIKDSPSFVWRALNKLGLVPRSDLFSHLTNEHIVEIYSAENVQLFRNFKFFEFCSYSLEELLTIEWWGLFERDAQITQKIFDYSMRVFTGELTESFVPDLETHFIREVASHDRLCFEYTIDRAGPLCRNKRPEAVILLERARIVRN